MNRISQIATMVMSGHRSFDKEFAKRPAVINAPSGPIPIACREGCFFCCHLEVAILPPEALMIGLWLHSVHPEKLVRFKEAVRTTRLAIGNRTGDERKAARVLCPFLENGRCGIYEVRPLSCRAWVSCDVHACERDFEDPAGENLVPSSMTTREMSIQLGTQMQGYARQLGVQSDGIELIRAMDIVLNDLSVPEKVEGGLSVF